MDWLRTVFGPASDTWRTLAALVLIFAFFAGAAWVVLSVNDWRAHQVIGSQRLVVDAHR